MTAATSKKQSNKQSKRLKKLTKQTRRIARKRAEKVLYGRGHPLEELLELALTWIAYIVVIAIPPVTSLYRNLAFSWNSVVTSPAARWIGLASERQQSAEQSPDKTELKPGNKVGRFTVTSGVGLRKSPGGKGSTDHQGVDLDTPIGTRVYAPRNTTVKCLQSTRGGKGASFKGVRGQVTLWHLSRCSNGNKKAGELIALTGNSGTATTGPHLHVEIHLGGDIVNPQMRDVVPLLKIKPRGEFSLELYKNWVSAQESAHNYSAVNPHSGALGKYQFMPGTLRSTAQNCPGVSPTISSSVFLASPQAQEKIMDCYLAQGWKLLQGKADDPDIQCRMLASYHYSGDPTKFRDTTPQTYKGKPYPSIAQYSKSVCREILP